MLNIYINFYTFYEVFNSYIKLGNVIICIKEVKLFNIYVRFCKARSSNN